MKRGYKIVRKDKAGLDPTKFPSPIDIAWAAGLYEGEGSCVASGQGGGSFSVQLSQKDPEILYRLRDLFGGGVRPYINGGFSIYHWTCCGDRGRVFLASIFHLLSARRKSQIESTCVKGFLDMVPGLVAQSQQANPCVTYARLWDAIQGYAEQQRIRAREHTRQRLAEFDRMRKLDPVRTARKKSLRRAIQQKRRDEREAQEIASITAGTSRFKTMEEREAERSYMRTYYKQKKAQSNDAALAPNSSFDDRSHLRESVN